MQAPPKTSRLLHMRMRVFVSFLFLLLLAPATLGVTATQVSPARSSSAAPSPALAACTAGQALFFHNAAKKYVTQNQLNAHHGDLLASTTFGSATSVAVSFSVCVQRGAFLFVASTGSGTANRVSAGWSGDVSAYSGVLMTPGTVSSGNTGNGLYSNIDTAAYINVTGLTSFGATTVTGQVFTVRIYNSAPNVCTPVTYSFTLTNPSCSSTSPTCALATSQGFQVCSEQNCNNPVAGNYNSYPGGAPVASTLSLSGSRYYVKFGNSDLAKITVRVNGRWVVSATGATSDTGTPYVFDSGPRYVLDLPWSTTTKNMLWFNISGYQSNKVCYEEGFQFIYGNTGVSLLDACPMKASGPCTTGAHGDPQFMGLRGQSYQVHGIDGGVYNIISNTQLQLNSKFVFLTGPRECPDLPSTGEPSLSCWTHDGSYLADIALLTAAGDRVHIAPGPAGTGFTSVTVNGKVLSVGDTVSLSDESGPVRGSVRVVSTHELVLRVNLFEIHLENIDGFVNLSHVQVVTVVEGGDTDADGEGVGEGEGEREIIKNNAMSVFAEAARLRELRTHGLLGQTWRVHRYKNRLKVIEGEVDDYLIGSGDLFGNDFVYNRFAVMEMSV